MLRALAWARPGPKHPSSREKVTFDVSRLAGNVAAWFLLGFGPGRAAYTRLVEKRSFLMCPLTRLVGKWLFLMCPLARLVGKWTFFMCPLARLVGKLYF